MVTPTKYSGESHQAEPTGPLAEGIAASVFVKGLAGGGSHLPLVRARPGEQTTNIMAASGESHQTASISIGSYGNEMGTKNSSQRKRAARREKMTEEEKSEEKKKRTIGQYNQWLRIINEMFLVLPTDYYDSFKGIWEPPDHDPYLPNHVYKVVYNRNRAP